MSGQVILLQLGSLLIPMTHVTTGAGAYETCMLKSKSSVDPVLPFCWPREKWPCPHTVPCSRRAALVPHRRGGPTLGTDKLTLGRDGPTSHHRHGTAGSTPYLSGWQSQWPRLTKSVTPTPISRTLSWPTPASIPSMTYLCA